jgi:hypothetical protein
MVKEREKESGPVAELRLDVFAPPAEFEEAVSRTCARVLRCEREGRPYRLLLGDRVLAGPDDAPLARDFACPTTRSSAGRRAKALSALALASPDAATAAPPAREPAPSRRRGTPLDKMPLASPSRGSAAGSRGST